MKKFLSVSLAAAMVAMTLTGCGGGDAAGTSDSDTIKIGATGPLTGSLAYYGGEVKQGAELAIDEINASGGVNGVQLELNFQDDEGDTEKVVNAYNTVKDWGAQVLIGAVTSDPSISVAAETANDNMFQITASGSAPDIVLNSANTFQVCFSDTNQGTASARYIAENNLAKKVAVIYESSSSYSAGIYENFAKEMKNHDNVEVVSAKSFTADNATDFSAQLQAAKDAGADLVFLPVYYGPACTILKQAADMQYAPTFFGCDGLDGILGVKGFDTALAEGVMLLTPFAADEAAEATQNFVKKYEDAYGVTPSQFAADAYDAVYIIAVAAKEAGITPDMSASDVCDALLPVMAEIEVEGVTSIEGVPMTWDENGMVDKAPKAVIIENGTYKAM